MTPAERLERTQWDFFWVPNDAEVVDRPEVAMVRCPRPIPHVNCVTRTRCEPGGLPALVDDAVAFHRHGTSRWLVPDTFDTSPLTQTLETRGYAPVQHHEARAIRPQDFRARPSADIEVRRVGTERELRDCIEVQRRAFSRHDPHDEAQIRSELAQCAEPGRRVHRFVAYRGNEPVSSGGFNWYPELRVGYLWAGGTVPEARGAGAYSALVAERIERAGAMGAEWVGLYAVHDTSAPIVAKQGFERVGEMTYWGRAGAQRPE